MIFKGKSIISIRDLERGEIDYIIQKAIDVKNNLHQNALKDKRLTTLFFEPSTRTRLSFESAMVSLGGSFFSVTDTVSSSVQKGETLKDTIKTISGYTDVIVMRHRIDGAARAATDVTSIPIINAGDGTNQHPTQTLLDLYTMKEEFGTIDTLNIGILGDLKYGRTAHSLVMALSHYNVTIFLISSEILKMPDHFKIYLQNKKVKFKEVDSLSDIGLNLDFLYVTRIQRERFVDPQEYEQVAHSYRITKDTLSILNPNIKIMHPLPRVDEIAYDIDKTENAIYFKQAHNGIPVRQAILGLVTGVIE